MCKRRILAEHFKSLRQRLLFVLLYVKKTSSILLTILAGKNLLLLLELYLKAGELKSANEEIRGKQDKNGAAKRRYYHSYFTEETYVQRLSIFPKMTQLSSEARIQPYLFNSYLTIKAYVISRYAIPLAPNQYSSQNNYTGHNESR